jgi:hypothetical protein
MNDHVPYAFHLLGTRVEIPHCRVGFVWWVLYGTGNGHRGLDHESVLRAHVNVNDRRDRVNGSALHPGRMRLNDPEGCWLVQVSV